MIAPRRGPGGRFDGEKVQFAARLPTVFAAFSALAFAARLHRGSPPPPGVRITAGTAGVGGADAGVRRYLGTVHIQNRRV